MNRNSSSAGLWIALGVVGALAVAGVFATGMGLIAYRVIDKQSHYADNRARTSTSSTYTNGLTSSPTTSWAQTATPTTPETVTMYGGIAYSGSGAYQTVNGYTDGFKAKDAAVAKCNSAIWSKGWGSDSNCGWVPLQTGECGAVATATVASGWGPTGWASGASTRAAVRQSAIDKCTSVGQGVCHELITFCM